MRLLHIIDDRGRTNAASSSSSTTDSSPLADVLQRTSQSVIRASLSGIVACLESSQAKEPIDVALIEWDSRQTGASDSADSHSGDAAGAPSADSALTQLLIHLRSRHRHSFLIVCTLDGRALIDASFRWMCFDALKKVEANCVTDVAVKQRDLEPLLMDVAKVVDGRKTKSDGADSSATSTPESTSASQAPTADAVYACTWCGMDGLSEDLLQLHTELWHANSSQEYRMKCPICDGPSSRYNVHIHDDHGPRGRGEIPPCDLPPHHLYPFSIVIVRRPSDGRYLLVQEFAQSGFWLPGGRCEPGENLSKAAIRECKEEAGVDITLKGVLRVEYTSQRAPPNSKRPGITRLRAIYYAEPTTDATSDSPNSSSSSSSSSSPSPVSHPKTRPDFESVGAVWSTMAEVKHLILRGREPLQWFKYIEEGKPIYPLDIIDEF